MLCTKRHFLDAIRWKAFTFFSVYENARDCIVSKALSKHLYIYSNPTLPLSEFMKNDFLITQYLNFISKNWVFTNNDTLQKNNMQPKQLLIFYHLILGRSTMEARTNPNQQWVMPVQSPNTVQIQGKKITFLLMVKLLCKLVTKPNVLGETGVLQKATCAGKERTRKPHKAQYPLGLKAVFSLLQGKNANHPSTTNHPCHKKDVLTLQDHCSYCIGEPTM